jgi:hypothetical protein
MNRKTIEERRRPPHAWFAGVETFGRFWGLAMTEDTKASEPEKATITLPGTVEKIIRPLAPEDPEKAQISVEGADHLYREIRVENELQDGKGQPVKLKEGAKVDVTIEAERSEIAPK